MKNIFKKIAKFNKLIHKVEKEYSTKKINKQFTKFNKKIHILKKIELKNYKLSRSVMLWFLFIPTLGFANLAFLINNYFGSAITLLFFLFIPGYLLLRIITYEIKSRWEIASFSLGLSLLLLMLGGLALNTLNIFGLKEPLTTFNIFVMLDTLTIALLFFNRNKTFDLPKRINFNFPLKNIVMFILLSILPFLAAGGAISLNNGGPNTLTMILFGLIPVLFVILVWRRDMESMYPYAVFMMGLSILFTNSLRGWFITGHDIHHEYSVFMNTFNNNLWPVRLATGDPYNACLSITILPTILAKISAISTMYIYKLLFQVIFALGLIPIYLFIKKYSNALYGILGAFIFITFPTFLNDMPFLNRQEIAFIFFGLLILTTFSELRRRPKLILSLALISGIMLSHYSSNYVTIALLALSWIGFIVLKRIQRFKDNFDIPIARLWVIILALALSFVWNYQITRSASNLERSLVQTIEDFKYKRSVKDRFLSYGLFEKSTHDARKEFEEFARKRGSSAKYVEPYELPLTPIGKAISPYVNVRDFNYGMHSFVAKIYQVLIILGIIAYYFKQKKLNLKKQTYFFIIGFSALALLAFFTVLPRLATDYSIIRLIQQTLILTALPIIFASEFIFNLFRRIKLPAITLLFVVLYLHSSGFIPQLIGGYKPQLTLNNAGTYYNLWLTHLYDFASIGWMESNRNKNLLVFVDTTTSKPLLDFPVYKGLINKSTEISNASGYLLLDYFNVNEARFRISIGDLTEYSDPKITFQRNLLYNNQGSNIYSNK